MVLSRARYVTAAGGRREAASRECWGCSPEHGTVPLQIMLWGGPVATVRSRDLFVNYPVSFSLRYLYIRPISRHVCVSVCRSQGVVA